MKEIVILSGKGGTGKTSIAAALAFLAGQDAVVADCDVDAANLHLLLRPDFAQTSEFFGGELAVIDQGRCSRCGICEQTCRFYAISSISGLHLVDPFSCEGCGYCEITCPDQAITMVKRKTGELFISTTRMSTPMVHARLDIGAENSGRLVALVKREANNLARASGKNFVIVDGSPGIGCPVISSLSGADFVLLVTEPTLSARHDLQRVHQLISRFRIKTGCIINKHDLNDDNTALIKEYLENEQIDHLADIEFSPIFQKALLEGKTIVEYQSPLASELFEIWDKIKKITTLKKE
ncbi:MAG: ATP-binding protein [Bacteroidales bacterium]